MRHLSKLHRTAGLLAAALLFELAITGMLLNHGHQLDLDNRFVENEQLLDWYGISSPVIDTSFTDADHWVSQIGTTLYLDNRPLHGHYSTLVGLRYTSDWVAICTRDTVLLVTSEGERIDTVATPAPVIALARNTQAPLTVLAETGAYSTHDLLNWDRAGETGNQRWQTPQPLPLDLQAEIVRHYRNHVLSIERVLQDLHSGRLAGTTGVLVVDLAGILALLLAATGVGLWISRWRRRRARART